MQEGDDEEPLSNSHIIAEVKGVEKPSVQIIKSHIKVQYVERSP